MDHSTRSDARQDQGIMRRVIVSALAITLAACASGYGSGPPGGPVSHVPPKILGTLPDTNATNVTQHELIIHFDKVINERPSASQATTLADLVIISPKNGEPDVDWHRQRLGHSPPSWLAREYGIYGYDSPGDRRPARQRAQARRRASRFRRAPRFQPRRLSGTHLRAAIGGAPRWLDCARRACPIGRPDTTLVLRRPG